jgi:hypothetical protein
VLETKAAMLWQKLHLCALLLLLAPSSIDASCSGLSGDEYLACSEAESRMM